MRIALCLSGQPRFFEKCSQSLIDNLIDIYNPDIFAHAWWDDNLCGKNFDTSQTHQEGKVGTFPDVPFPALLVITRDKSLTSTLWLFPNHRPWSLDECL